MLVCVIHKGEKGLSTTQEGGGWLYILSHGYCTMYFAEAVVKS